MTPEISTSNAVSSPSSNNSSPANGSRLSRGRALRLVVAGATFACVGALGAGTASAHVAPDKTEVAAGSYTDVQLGVPHGCDGSPTTKIEVQIPEALDAVTPYVVPGWTGAVTKAKLDPPVKSESGDEITERDSVVTWTAEPGNELPDHWKIQFGLSFKVPDQEGEALEFKTIQTCEEGSTSWTEETPEGGEEPEHPAPTVMIVAATGEGGHGGSATETNEAASGSEAAGSATSDDKSDDDSSDSSKGLAIGALVVGLGALGLGGAAFAKANKAGSAGKPDNAGK